MIYKEEPLQKFLDDLSANIPAPGGGSAAALVGAIAAGLNCMVGNFTAGNEKYKNFEAEIKGLLKESEILRDELTGLIQADIDEYSMVTKAYKLPKTNDSEKELRLMKIKEATKKAMEVPLRIMVLCRDVLKTCIPLLTAGNKNLLSDIGVAAIFAMAGTQSAYLNVKINLFYLKDEEYKSKILRDTGDIIEESERMERQVMEECSKNF